ncbi:nucleoside triphosphate pyrophosphohydrolase [Rickettsiaceae bacterium]|nr:nucleoside triphosphate pyrophosphohydrolase [Rickettsiaceae bacterium]
MYQYQFNKLIRSNLPDRMEKEGVFVNSEALSSKEYIKQLKNKIIEEANEVAESTTIEELEIELADVMEVIHALAEANGLDISGIEAARVKKRQENGCFHPSCYVHDIKVAKDNHKVIEYLENKNIPYKHS